MKPCGWEVQMYCQTLLFLVRDCRWAAGLSSNFKRRSLLTTFGTWLFWIQVPGFLKQMQTQVVLWRVAQCNAQIGCMWKYGNMYTLVYPQMPILMGQMMINQWSWGSWGCPIFQTQMLAPLTWVKSIPRTCPLATAQPTSSKLNSFNFQFLPITSRGPQARTEKMTCYDRKCWLSINHDYPLSPRSHCSM